MKKKIALAGPSITQKEIDYVTDAVKNGWYETYDMHIKKLEQTFAEYVGSKYAIATYCGTHALHLATLAAGLGKGDEVIVTDQSYIATAFAVDYVGATPVFVDIDENTLCIDASKIEEAVTAKTKAIMVVHFAGYAADMDAVKEIADKYNLMIIEDACQSVGTKYKNKYTGTIGDMGTFSAQGSKIAVGGEGGMFVTNDSFLYEKALHFGSFCRNDAIAYLYSDDIGYNYRISNITAALILAQIERIDELINMKKKIYEAYCEHLYGIEEIEILSAPVYCETNYGYTVGYLNDKARISRDELIKELVKRNIHFRPGYPSMSSMPFYEKKYLVKKSERFFKQGLVFPTALNLTDDDIKYVCDTLIEILRG